MGVDSVEGVFVGVVSHEQRSRVVGGDSTDKVPKTTVWC